MNTTFVIRICGTDGATARGMARECCDQLDYLENRLSRFIDGSDISRINHLKAGETIYVSDACHRCLLSSVDACRRTGGLFDITLGKQIQHLKSAATAPPPELAGTLIIHPDVAAVTCHAEGRELDLGGIGKGFALDELRQMLREWGAEGGLLAAGASSLLAFGPDVWPVDLGGAGRCTRIGLANGSLSASGTGIQGSHIVHPAGKQSLLDGAVRRVWVTAATATTAEIWSTALMLVDPTELPAIMAANPEILGIHHERGERIEEVVCGA